MEPLVLDDILGQIRTALEENDLTTASSVIEALRPADQADVFSDLDDEQQATLLPRINPADAADIIEELYDEEAAELAVGYRMAGDGEGVQCDFMLVLAHQERPGWDGDKRRFQGADAGAGVVQTGQGISGLDPLAGRQFTLDKQGDQPLAYPFQ